MKLKIGDQAPDFEANDQNGNLIELKQFREKKVVLYFYPKDNTPGCSAQACDLRDHYQEMKNKNYEILGVSTDNIDSHKKFVEKYDLPFSLLDDAKKTIHEKYGTWGEKKMYGKTYMGTKRTTFIIDETGKITDIIEQVKTKEHHKQIL